MFVVSINVVYAIDKINCHSMYCNSGGSRVDGGARGEVEPASLLELVSFSSFSVATDINVNKKLHAFWFCDVICSA